MHVTSRFGGTEQGYEGYVLEEYKNYQISNGFSGPFLRPVNLDCLKICNSYATKILFMIFGIKEVVMETN